jgi:hypothetical protein
LFKIQIITKKLIANLIMHLKNPRNFFVSFVTKIQIKLKLNLAIIKDNKIFKNNKKIANFERQKFYHKYSETNHKNGK